jgi:putative transposase
MTQFEIPAGWTAQAYRFALDPTPTQVRELESHCGAARFVFNHMLAHVKAVADQRAAERSYGIPEAELTPPHGWSLSALRKTWNERKAIAAPWWPANSKEAYNSGLDGLARALDAWAKSRTGKRAGAPVGFPRFKSKHAAARSVRFSTGAIRVEEDRHHVVLPRLGRIRTHESTRKLARRQSEGTARILSATVTYSGGRWFCAFQVIVAGKTRPADAARSPHPVVGVDVGVKDLLVVAAPDGVEVDRIPAPKPLSAAQAKLRALQHRAARQHGSYDAVTQTRREPSKRWLRTQRRIGRAHARAAHVRSNAIHQATTALAQQHEVVVVEQLNAAGMGRRGGARKRGLNRALRDAALGRIRTLLGYKSSWYRARLVTAPRFFASTQLCSRCGVKTKLALGDRTYRCRKGCPSINRDLNAAINLARLGDPTSCGGDTGTGTGSRPAASVTAGDGRGANQKTSPTTSVAGRQEAMKRQPRTPTRRGRQLRKEKLPEMRTTTSNRISGNGLEVGHDIRV